MKIGSLFLSSSVHLSNLTRKVTIAMALRKLSRVVFGVVIISVPMRMRIELLARPLDAVYRDYTDFLIFYSDMLFLVVLALWIPSLFLDRRNIRLGPPFLWLPMAGLTLFGGVSVLFSIDTALSFYHSVRLIFVAWLYLYVVNEIRSIRQIIVPLSLLILSQAMVGIVQVLNQHSVGLGWLGEYELDPAWSGVSVVLGEGGRSLRAYGLTDHPNILGGNLAFALILVASYFVRSRDKWRTWLIIVFAMGLVGLLLTFSRAAILSLMVGLSFIGISLLKRHQKKEWTELVQLVGAGVIIMAPFIWQNSSYIANRIGLNESFNSVYTEKRSISERAALNQVSNRIFADHATTGVGLGAAPIAIQQQMPDFPYYYQPPHIALLEAAVEIGIFGSLFYLLTIITPWLGVWWLWRRGSISMELLCVSSLLLAITVVGFFDYYPWLSTPGRMWQWMAWGLWAGQYMKTQPGDSGG